MIYRWYKILSPRIVLDIECDEYNQKSQILFVDIHQIFSIFFVPFYKSDVHLTTKIKVVHSEQDGKYYIKSQEDLYQLNEVVKFFWPGGATILWLWQVFATGMCILGALFFAPITWLEQKYASGQVNGIEKDVWGAQNRRNDLAVKAQEQGDISEAANVHQSLVKLWLVSMVYDG